MIKRIICILFICITTNLFAETTPTKPATMPQEELPVVSDKVVKNRPQWSYTAYGEKLYNQQKIGDNGEAVSLFNPNYLLPFYYTQIPDEKVYGNTTPNNQKIMRQELQAQFSIAVPVVKNIFNPGSSFDIAYTQLMVWQVYAKSQYFRETNYMPEVFITEHYGEHWTGRYSVIHDSNGRGGDMERSWNRIYAETIYSQRNWMVSVKPWIVIFQHDSTTIHNPDIARYMGHGEIRAAYKTDQDLVVTLMSRNNIESRFDRGAEEATFSFPVHGHFRGYIKVFSGYGQTLIEYNHYTNAFGIGVMLNDVI